jgi:ABC-type uncharacterized transport system substrate-binding protein
VQQALRELGYIEGKNAVYEVRSADGVAERLPQLAAELVKLKVDVIVAEHGVPTASAAKQATATIPIVFTSVGDPVAFGLVPNLANPGGNVTGMASLAPELSRKQLELLKQAVPTLSHVIFLRNPDNPADMRLSRDREAAARALGMDLQEFDVRTLEPQDRAAASDALLRHLGGRIIGLYYTPGAEYDGFALFEAPDDATAAGSKLRLLLSAT